MDENPDLAELTAEIVSAYVSNNNVRPDDLGSLISDVHAALQRAPHSEAKSEPEPQEPAVSVRKSVTPDYIVCLEDGKKFKSLKRHIKGEHGLTPGEYRAKWGLRSDYPLVAPAYSEARSNFAKTIGLGRKASVQTETPGQKASSATRKRGRRSAAAE